MILASLNKYRDMGLLIIRIGVGIAMAIHGWPKISGGPAFWAQIGGAMGNVGIHFLPTFWGFMAALVEFGGGILLALGLLFRPACILLVFLMAMAVLFHLNSPPPMNQFNQGWSHAFELGVVFLGLLFLGPGKYSVDRH